MWQHESIPDLQTILPGPLTHRRDTWVLQSGKRLPSAQVTSPTIGLPARWEACFSLSLSLPLPLLVLSLCQINKILKKNNTGKYFSTMLGNIFKAKTPTKGTQM